MNIIKNVTLILLMLLSTTNIYADSTKLFDDNATTNQSSRDMVGDDGMVEENIDIGVRYRVNMGEKTDTVTEDESGNISITDANGTTTTGKLSEFNHEPYRTEEFEDLKKASINYFLENAANTDKRIDLNSTDEEVRENWDKLQHQNEEKSQLQIKQNKFIKDNGSSLLNNKEVFLNKRSPFRGGNSAIDSFTNNISKITDEKFMGQEDNATKYYKEKVGVTPGYNPKQELMQRNIGALSNAYSNIDDITKKLTEKLNGSKISCQITRDLIPSFYCPLTGKQGLRFPGTDVNGLHEVNQDEELKKCNDYCMTDITEVNGTDGTFDHLEGEIPCVSEQVMPSSDLNISEDIDLEIYPTYSSTATQRAITTNGIIPIDTITITIEIPNPNQKGNTPEDQKYLDNEWKKFLRNNPLTMRINLAIDKKWNKSDNIRDDEDTVTHKSYIAQNRTVLINSPKVEFSFSYNGELSDKYYIELKKPYFRFLTAQNKFINSGAKVTIKNLTARYMSDSYYYCTGTQFVGNPLDCKGNTRAITVAGTPQYLCSDQAHKRGPVATEYGGFYNNDSCVRACVRRRECLSTYTHYSNQVESDGSPSVAMLQSSIDCVESPTEINGACTKQICENFFKDDIFPINEILVAKDNTNIYTVKDGALTDHPRPKVDYEREINAPNLTLAWQEEEKDAAYRQMIRDLTYNRIKYRIGEVSPANVAVKEEPITINQTKIIGYLKPKSNDFTKTGYIYAVLRLEHWYRPVAGVYMIDGKIISVGDNTDVRFKDVTYAIKLSDTNEDWKIFRRIEAEQTLIEKNFNMTNPDGTISITKRKVWVDIPAYTKDTFGYYNPNNDSFAVISKNSERATHFSRTEFNVNQNYFVYNISDSIQDTMVNLPGGLIRNQISTNNGTNFIKIYNEDKIDLDNGSHIVTYYLYLTYSLNPLTYDSLMRKIEGNDYMNNPTTGYESRFGLTEMVNKIKYKTEIEHDGELQNNIKPIIKGPTDSQTVSVEWTPAYREKGKKVYNFIFLYNDSEATDWSPPTSP